MFWEHLVDVLGALLVPGALVGKHWSSLSKIPAAQQAVVVFYKYFFGVPHLATFISFFIKYVIASIAYIHPVYGGIRTHDLLDVSLLP
jgi:hypothetical protein